MGWNWPLQMAKHNEVWVFTRPKYRQPIEQALPGVANRDRLHFVYVDWPRWALFWKQGSYGMWLYNWVWQYLVYRAALRTHRQIRFDLAHYVNFGVWRVPCHLWRLGIPLVWGPVGGGQEVPRGFARTLGIKGRAIDLARSIAQRLSWIDPFVRATRRHAAKTLVTDRETQRWLAAMPGPEPSSDSAQEPERFPGIGALFLPSSPLPAHDDGGPLRLLWVSRLVPYKGLPLMLRAFALASESTDCRLTILGLGPEYRRCIRLAQQLGIDRLVSFVGRVQTHDQVLSLYAEAQLFVFTSLRDSSGMALLEAMSAGLPSICLDHGGPGTIATPQCAVMIEPLGEGETQRQIAAAIVQLARDPARRKAMSQAARERATTALTWNAHGQRMQQTYSDVLAGARLPSGSATVTVG